MKSTKGLLVIDKDEKSLIFSNMMPNSDLNEDYFDREYESSIIKKVLNDEIPQMSDDEFDKLLESLDSNPCKIYQAGVDKIIESSNFHARYQYGWLRIKYCDTQEVPDSINLSNGMKPSGKDIIFSQFIKEKYSNSLNTDAKTFIKECYEDQKKDLIESMERLHEYYGIMD